MTSKIVYRVGKWLIYFRCTVLLMLFLLALLFAEQVLILLWNKV
jgi:hypothetical protein